MLSVILYNFVNRGRKREDIENEVEDYLSC